MEFATVSHAAEAVAMANHAELNSDGKLYTLKLCFSTQASL